MPSNKNEFDDFFISESTEKKPTKKAVEQKSKKIEEPEIAPELTPEVDAALEDMFISGGNAPYADSHDYTPAIAGAGVGAVLGKKGIFSPSAQMMASSRGTPFAEKMFGAPPGSVAQAYEAMNPTAPSLQAASRGVAQSTYPTVAEMERMLQGATTPENITGRQGVSAFNTETSRLAEMDKLGKMKAEMLRKQGLAPSGVNPILESGPMGVTKGGIHVPATTVDASTQATAVKTAAEKAAADAAREAEVSKTAGRTTKAARLAAPLAAIGKVLSAAGTGAGVADTAARLYGKDYKGAAISGAATALPYVAGGANLATLPLSLFALWAHDNPEKVKELMKSMQSSSPGYDYTQQMMGP